MFYYECKCGNKFVSPNELKPKTKRCALSVDMYHLIDEKYYLCNFELVKIDDKIMDIKTGLRII